MNYFPNEMRDTEHIAWVRNSFEVDFSKLFIFFRRWVKTDRTFVWSTSYTVSLKFETVGFARFWFRISNDPTALSEREGISCYHFTTIYPCESGFSAMTAIETKYRNSLHETDDCDSVCRK